MRASASPAVLLLLRTAALVAAADQALPPTHAPGSGDESKSYTTALGNIEGALVPGLTQGRTGETPADGVPPVAWSRAKDRRLRTG